MLHSAYSFAFAFDAGLVRKVLDRLGLDHGSTILDPFCGTGTTLLECKQRGVASVGVDANPVCVLVSKAKTNWRVNISEAQRLARVAICTASKRYHSCIDRCSETQTRISQRTIEREAMFSRSPAGRYLVSSGLLRRGWISPRPAMKTLLLAERLWGLPERPRNFLLLCLLGLLVPEISNMSYGPEIYRARRRRDRDVFGLFEQRVSENSKKLEALRETGISARTLVRAGDSVNGGLRFLEKNKVQAVLTSPPYLSDHDYSRLTRLELVFSGEVASAEELRKMKRRLLRSSSKNVYKGDNAAQLVRGFGPVKSVIEEISERAADRDSGFARVYPRLVGEYFGDMYKHFQSIGRVLPPGGQAAYIVGDQSSFFATPIPSAKIIAELAEYCRSGLRLEAMEPVKEYRGSRGAVSWSNREWLLLFRKRGRRTTIKKASNGAGPD